MSSSRRVRFFSSSSSFSSSTLTYLPHGKSRQIHIDSSETPIPVTVHLPTSNGKATGIAIDSSSENFVPIAVDLPASFISPETAAAIKIQSAYRSHLVRTLVKKISSVNSQANRLQHRLQCQETVDAIRFDEREKLRMNEALMSLLLLLDSVPGFYPTIRELRRSASRRINGLLEILDAVSTTPIDDGDGFLTYWDEALAQIEEDVCKERGGEEMERFCAEHLGFRCMQRFLRGL